MKKHFSNLEYESAFTSLATQNNYLYHLHFFSATWFKAQYYIKP